MKIYDDLQTPFVPKDSAHPLPEYPRPLLKRDSYMNLNGLFDFEINQTGRVPKEFSKKINVPYPIESTLSGVKKQITKRDYIIYSKKFNVDKDFIKDISILHIDAIDQLADIYFNGEKVGKHDGGYLPVSAVIKLKEGENKLDVVVRDLNSNYYPTGKQKEKRGGTWYTTVSGIWQTVWIESVSKDYIRDVKITPNIDLGDVKIEIDTTSNEVEVFVYDKDTIIYQESVVRNVKFKLNEPKYWSPENPFLYNVVLKTKGDTVKTYFAYRKFSIDDNHFLLNNKPYFINGVLDQGYFSDGIYTPRDYAAYKFDIETMKKLGFNALRKHVKVEPQMYYYFCDTIGMLVMQDMVNFGEYSFQKDSLIALPFVKLEDAQKNNFIKHSKETINLLYNHPCVCYYTIFNEGWGQFDADYLYDVLKGIDSSRVYDATSGFYRQKKSDVASLHFYGKPIKLKEETKPIIISGFGGFSFPDMNHSYNGAKTFGYKKFTTKKAYEDGLRSLYQDEIYPIKDKIIGVVYAQASDVEDETNGILTYDRQVQKLDPEFTKPIFDELTKDN